MIHKGFLVSVVLVLASILVGPASSEPNYLDDSDDHIFWAVQISDLHLSMFHDPTRISSFEFFCKQILSFIRPPLVIASGDLTDGKSANGHTTMQYEDEWKTYSRIIAESNATDYAKWLDLRGNHDNFGVADRQAPNNYYNKYGMMKSEDHSYLYKLKTESGDEYSFIGVDACLDPGPRRPLNFYGNLKNSEFDKLKNFSAESVNSNGTVWFGHYPTSTISQSSRVREVMKNGVAYLCGHLHTVGGLMPAMYSRQSNGILELELSDWKRSRKFRIFAFDAGLFSVRDFIVDDDAAEKASANKLDTYALITNPKSNFFRTTNDREPLGRMKSSTHVRVLVFSKYPIDSVQVFIDEMSIGFAKQVKEGKPLYALKWNPADYLQGSHKIKVIVKDSFENLFVTSQDFSLDNTLKPFKFFPTLLVRSDQLFLTRFIFFAMVFAIVLVLVLFRFNRNRFTISLVSCGFVRSIIMKQMRRLALLTSIDYIFYLLIFSTIYVAIGPWYIGEILDGHIGVCFAWGVYVKGILLNADIQITFGIIYLVFFQALLMIHLSYQVEKRFMTMSFHEDSRAFRSNSSSSPNLVTTLRNSRAGQVLSALKSLAFACVRLLFVNLTFVLLVVVCLFQLYDLFLSYSFISVLVCPIYTWMLVLAIFLRYKSVHLTTSDFNKFIDTSKFRSSNIPSTSPADSATPGGDPATSGYSNLAANDNVSVGSNECLVHPDRAAAYKDGIHLRSYRNSSEERESGAENPSKVN